MRKTLTSACLAATLSGCIDPIGPIVLDFSGWDGCYYYCGVDFDVSPSGANMLTGDTLRMSTRSTTGHELASWTSSSDAVSFVASSGLVREVRSPVSNVLVKAIHAGVADIDVRAIDTTYKMLLRLHVADSSAITTIRLWYGGQPFSPPVGARFSPTVHLLDSIGREFHASPTGWSTSAPLVLSIESTPMGIELVAKRPGTATITATFLGVSQSTTMTVVP